MQRQVKYRLLDVIPTMKVDGLLKEIVKEETKFGLELNFIGLIILVMNPLKSRRILAIMKGHIIRRSGHGIQEAPQSKPQVEVRKSVFPCQKVSSSCYREA